MEAVSHRSMERPSPPPALDEGTAHGAGVVLVEEDHEKQPVYVFRGAPMRGKTTLYAQFFGEGDFVHKVSGMSGEWAGKIQEPVG